VSRAAVVAGQWTLRDATLDDLDAIMHLERTTFATDAWSEAAMRGDLKSSHTRYLVAAPSADPERVQGYAGLLAPRGSGDADIQTIAVTETVRGQGLGRALMVELLGEAQRRGARSVFLEVRADNPGAEHLYETLGFLRIAVRPQYYQPDGVDAHVMKLTFSELVEGASEEPIDELKDSNDEESNEEGPAQ
jgi:ribosomal-protein-alanine N-acetyltransferase